MSITQYYDCHLLSCRIQVFVHVLNNSPFARLCNYIPAHTSLNPFCKSALLYHTMSWNTSWLCLQSLLRTFEFEFVSPQTDDFVFNYKRDIMNDLSLLFFLSIYSSVFLLIVSINSTITKVFFHFLGTNQRRYVNLFGIFIYRIRHKGIYWWWWFTWKQNTNMTLFIMLPAIFNKYVFIIVLQIID